MYLDLISRLISNMVLLLGAVFLVFVAFYLVAEIVAGGSELIATFIDNRKEL